MRPKNSIKLGLTSKITKIVCDLVKLSDLCKSNRAAFDLKILIKAHTCAILLDFGQTCPRCNSSDVVRVLSSRSEVILYGRLALCSLSDTASYLTDRAHRNV